MIFKSAYYFLKNLNPALRVLIYTVFITGVTFLLWLCWFRPHVRMERAITKIKSANAAVRSQGIKDALGLPLSTQDQERLAAVLRSHLDTETVAETKANALGLMWYTAVSERNIDTLVKHALSENTDIALTAIEQMGFYATRYPQQAWKIVPVLSLLKSQDSLVGEVAAGKFENLFGENQAPASLGIVDSRLKLKYYELDFEMHFEVSEYACDVVTGEKLAPKTQEKLTIEAKEFARKFNLPE